MLPSPRGEASVLTVQRASRQTACPLDAWVSHLLRIAAFTSLGGSPSQKRSAAPSALFRSQPRGALDPEELPRPAQWSTSPAIAVPKDARLVELRISFENPDYVTLRLP